MYTLFKLYSTLFVPSNIKLGSAFIVTLVKLVFDFFMLTLLNQINLLSCVIVTLITLIGHIFMIREWMNSFYP